MRYAVAFAIFFSLTSCDSDNLHWRARSNPSGTPPHPQGGTVIVVTQSRMLSEEPSQGSGTQKQGDRGSGTQKQGDRDSGDPGLSAADRSAQDRGVEVYLLTSLEGILPDAGTVPSETIRIADLQGDTIVELRGRHLLRLEPAR